MRKKIEMGALKYLRVANVKQREQFERDGKIPGCIKASAQKRKREIK